MWSLFLQNGCRLVLELDLRRGNDDLAMKIYTKTGDDGTTGLFGGDRVRKSDARIECYGTVDELNAALGVANVVAGDTAIGQAILRVQNELFVVGSHLSTPEDSPSTRSLPLL